MSTRRRMTGLSALTGGLTIALALTACGAAPSVPASVGPTETAQQTDAPLLAGAADADFYVPPTPLGDGEPGDIIRSEEIRSPVSGMRLWTVLYRSVGLDGEPMAVSGVIAAPEDAGAGPHRFISWAHGTTGLIDSTAPSQGGALTLDVDLLFRYVDDGFVVVATDYDGLGTPGPHPYLVGESEGRSVLDAARAARSFIGPQETDAVVLAGHSQGGHAALFAAELAPTYAADLPVVGTVAIAPAGDMAGLVSSGVAETADEDHRLLALLVIAAWHETLGLATDAVLTPAGTAQADALVDEARGSASPVDDPVFLADPANIPRMARRARGEHAWRARLAGVRRPHPHPPGHGRHDHHRRRAASSSQTDTASAELPPSCGSSKAMATNLCFTSHLAEIDEWISQRLAGTDANVCE